LLWDVVTWKVQASDLGQHIQHQGNYTATLCETCQQYGWYQCWSCGELTANERGPCNACYAKGIGEAL
jgi:hypothetical protein